MTTNTLQPTSWLAKRLGLSASTIERLRARGEGELPPHITVGLHTIRYEEDGLQGQNPYATKGLNGTATVVDASDVVALVMV